MISWAMDEKVVDGVDSLPIVYDYYTRFTARRSGCMVKLRVQRLQAGFSSRKERQASKLDWEKHEHKGRLRIVRVPMAESVRCCS